MSSSTYVGTSCSTGASLGGTAHLQQSIADILTTPIGSRIQRREYGSAIPMLLDHPMNGLTLMRLKSAAIMALLRWEPRLRPGRITFPHIGQGSLVAELQGMSALDGSPVTMQINLGRGAV